MAKKEMMVKTNRKMAEMKKNKSSFILSTFKVEEIKVVLFFSFEAVLTLFWPFFGFCPIFKKNGQKMVKMAPNEKN